MPKLVMLRNGTVVREVRLGLRDLTIGRAEDNDVVLDDPDKSVSRYHAEVRLEGHDYVIVDVGSQNGVWVGEKQVRETDLTPGMCLSIGSFEIRCDAAPGDPGFASGDWADRQEAQPAQDAMAAETDATFTQLPTSTPVRPDAPYGEEPPVASHQDAHTSRDRQPQWQEPVSPRPGRTTRTPEWRQLALVGGTLAALMVALFLGQAWLRKPAAPGAADAMTGAGDTNAASAADREIAQHMADARTALDAGRLQDARAAVRLALNIRSDHPDALALETRIENAIAGTAVQGAPQSRGAQTPPTTVPGDSKPAVAAPRSRAQTEPPPWPMLAALPNESPASRRERSRVMFERFTIAKGWLLEEKFADAHAEIMAILTDAPGYEPAATLEKDARDGENRARGVMSLAWDLQKVGDLTGAMAEFVRTKQLDRSDRMSKEVSGEILKLRGLMTIKGNALFAQAELLYGKKRLKEAADQYQLVLDHLLPSDPNFEIAKSRRDAILAGRVKAPEPAE